MLPMSSWETHEDESARAGGGARGAFRVKGAHLGLPMISDMQRNTLAKSIRESWRLWSLIVFPLAGFVSASLSVWVRGAALGRGILRGLWLLLWTVLGRWNPLGSLTLGLVLAGCLWLFFGLRSPGKTL